MPEPRRATRNEGEQQHPPAARGDRRIAYLHPGSDPSRYANSVHAMRMCDAFTQAGHDVTLFTAPGDFTVRVGLSPESV